MRQIDALMSQIDALPPLQIYGQVTAAKGMVVEVSGLSGHVAIGSRLNVETAGSAISGEVVGFKEDRAVCLPFGALTGVTLGAKAWITGQGGLVRPSASWLGRVVDGLGQPADGKGPLIAGPQAHSLRSEPPAAHARTRMGGKIDTGVRVLNSFVPCCAGQRMGIFAGSGVGKSVLMSMLAKYTACDVAVIGLIGERGREVQEFIEDDLGPEGLKRSVVVVATSDQPALVRREAALMTLTLAEYFRDQGQHVLCMMDSVTRYAMALREIGLAGGEPPTSRGYTPSVFAELPRLLERAGPGPEGAGDITGLFTVLVDGDDHNEPVADAVRGILDGHIVMERAIAERGRYPAINVLKSVSRALPRCFTDEENAIMRRARKVLSTYEDMAELIRLGAYRKGSDPEVDRAIALYPDLEGFLSQMKDESTNVARGFQALSAILESDAQKAVEGS